MRSDLETVEAMENLVSRLDATKGIREGHARALIIRSIRDAYTLASDDQQRRIRALLITRKSKAFPFIQ